MMQEQTQRKCSDLTTLVAETGLDRRTVRRLAIETGSLLSIGHGRKRPTLLILNDKFWRGLESYRVIE